MSKTWLKSFRDISRITDEPVCSIEMKDLIELPHLDSEPPMQPASDSIKESYDISFDGFTAFGIGRNLSDSEKKRISDGFLRGLEKLFDPNNNWTFLQAFKLSMEYCVQCQTCSEQCHVFIASGRQEIYRPTFRSEILRRIYKRHFTPGGKLLGPFFGADIEVNYKTALRLLESSYRCSICRRCAQVCPVGVDNALIAREIRKLFSQELGIAPKELFQSGTRKHLSTGSAVGMKAPALKNIIEFMEEEIHEKAGRKIKIPVDKKSADMLLYTNAGEFVSWPESIEACAILFDAAGINYTYSTEAIAIDGVNYGVYFDDFEFARIGLRQLQVARELGVKKIIVGECGHAHKAFCVIGDRIFPGDLSMSEIPRESIIPLLWEIVRSGKIKFDPSKNDFFTTLQDPCNIVRNIGIVKPQRNIINALNSRFREMEPHGVRNYCCGGGSGFGIMNSYNFTQWREKLSIRLKTKQILEVFSDVLDKKTRKYIVAPCSNCKGTMREIRNHYGLGDKYNISYTGLSELIVNAMVDIPEPFLKPEEE